MKKKGIHQQDRRTFLLGIGAAGVSAAFAAPVLAASGKDSQFKWDREHEVVIIGSGFAGLAAAIQAKRLGAKDVVIYEQMPVFGGNSAISGGLFAAPGTPLQEKEGVEDSAETMANDQMKAGRGIANEPLLRHIAARANEALQITIDAGAEYFPYLQHLGGHSVPRTYQTTVSSGGGITQPLVKECRRLGVQLVNRAKFDNFIVDENGSVIGAVIYEGHYFGRGKRGKPVNIRSQRGLLIASGGFASNIGLRSAQDPTLTAEVPSTNQAGATGEAMLEMFRVGAVPVHLAHIQTGPWASPDEEGFGYVSNYSIYNFPHSISVFPKTGRRFMNEIADRKTRSDAQLDCRDENGDPLPPVTITSFGHAKEHPSLEKVLKYGVGWKFETLEELAAHFNIPLHALRKQVDEYNSYVKSGDDKQFGKSMEAIKGKYIEAPFVTVRNWPKVHYCQGGVQIDVQARVIDSSSWKPIPGLFAAGEVSGGTHGLSRLGSCSIPDCMVMGMTAAETMMSS